MKECDNCGFNSEYGYCECPHSDRWYACPIENTKPENIQALKEYAELNEDGEMEKEKAIRKHREEAIEALRELREIMLESENWENMKRLIDAVTMGAFAIERLNKIDFGEVE